MSTSNHEGSSFSHKDKLDKVLDEADQEGVGKSIREMWKIDSQKVFRMIRN